MSATRFSILLLHLWLFAFFVGQIVCPPVDPKKPSNTHPSNEKDQNSIDEMGIEYNRYLKEVVQILESDPEFRKKLETSDPEDIRTGKIAKELDYVNHHVRGKLDELKRQEMERLRHAAMQQFEHARGLGIPPNQQRLKIPGHLDHKNPTFEMEDLRKLILQTTKDLEEMDRKRKEEFKAYELQKEFEHREKMKEMDEAKRKEEERVWNEAQQKHKQHPKVHHPGSKQQYEEVWEEQDHLDPQNFNPKTFFSLHDLDGNGYWDQDEVKALFGKELDKVYDPNAPEDDMAERYEEMERMREHVFNETDVNRDYLISFEEFLDQTRKQEFERDPGWQTLDEQPVYSEQEYLEFERQRQMEIQRLIEQGMLPPHPGMPMPHPNAVPMYGVPPPQQHGGQYIPPPPPPQMKKITPEEAAKYQQQQQQQVPYGQVQYAPPPQQQPYVQQPPVQYGQPQYAPPQYNGQQPQVAPQQVQYGQPQYAPQQQWNNPPPQQPPQWNPPPQPQQWNPPPQQQPVQQQPVAQQPIQQQPIQQQPIQQQPIQQQPIQQQPIQQQQPVQQAAQPASNQQPPVQQPAQNPQVVNAAQVASQQAQSAQIQPQASNQLPQQPSVKVN